MCANFYQDETFELFWIFDIENFRILQSQFLCRMITSEKKWLKFCGNVEFVYIYCISPLGKRIVYLRLKFFTVFFKMCDFEKSHFMYQFEIYRLFCMRYIDGGAE